MEKLRFLIQNILRLSLCLSLVLGSVDIYAAPPTKKKGSSSFKKSEDGKPRPYINNSFCEAGAKDMMSDLNDENKKNFERIDKIKKEISDLHAYNNVITQVTSLRDKYEESLKNMSDFQNKKFDQPAHQMAAHLDNMKTVVKNGLTLNALSLLMKDEDFSKSDNKDVTMKDLCLKPANKSQPVCKPSVAQKLDPALKNFQAAQKEMPELKNNTAKIINSIPKDISPEIILKILDEKSPKLGSLLAQDFPREKLLKCLDGKSSSESTKACQGILENSKDRDALFSAVTRESKEVNGVMAQNFSAVLNATAEVRKDELAKILTSKTSEERFKESATKIINDAKSIAAATNLNQIREKEDNKAIKNRIEPSAENTSVKISSSRVEPSSSINGLANLLYSSPNIDKMNLDEVAQKQSAAFLEAQTKARDLENACDFSGSSGNVEKCRSLLNQVSDKVRYIQSEHTKKVTELQNEMKKIQDDEKFKSTEKLKKYVAEKYLRTCAKNVSKMKQVSSDVTLDINTGGCNYTSQLNLSKLEGLSKDVSDIFLNTEFALDINPNSPTSEETFSKEELAGITKQCNTLSPAMKESLGDICNEVKSDNQAREKVLKASRDWEKLNDEYYYTYSRNAPGGYIKTKKKSTAAIIGLGVAPALPNLLGMWLGNFQTKLMIDQMTDQAIYQKQMLHNIDVYNKSPWMIYGYDYFNFQAFNLASVGTSATGTSTTPAAGVAL